MSWLISLGRSLAFAPERKPEQGDDKNRKRKDKEEQQAYIRASKITGANLFPCEHNVTHSHLRASYSGSRRGAILGRGYSGCQRVASIRTRPRPAGATVARPLQSAMHVPATIAATISAAIPQMSVIRTFSVRLR